jgi:predicted small metal-binding protein
MTKSIKCADLFPGCDFHAEAESEEQVLQKAAEHAASIHNVTELTDEIVAKVKGAIRDTP